MMSPRKWRDAVAVGVVILALSSILFKITPEAASRQRVTMSCDAPGVYLDSLFSDTAIPPHRDDTNETFFAGNGIIDIIAGMRHQ